MLSDREIRVFVSSSFRDMQREREHLIKDVFPRLRKLCESRDVTWHAVDLRWGITDIEFECGEVSRLCLREIDRCRPSSSVSSETRMAPSLKRKCCTAFPIRPEPRTRSSTSAVPLPRRASPWRR